MVEIALMSVTQSDLKETEGRSSSFAFVIPVKRASDSAIRREPTSSMTFDPDTGEISAFPVKTHATLTRFVAASQAAST